jgi:hypothetical protein
MMAAKFRMPNIITLLMGVVFVLIMGGYFPGLIVLVVIIVALIIGFIISKLGKN